MYTKHEGKSTTAWVVVGLLVVGALFTVLFALGDGQDREMDTIPDVATTTNGAPADSGDPALRNEVSCSTTDPDVRRVVSEPYQMVSESTAAGTVTVTGQIVMRQRIIFGQQVNAVHIAVVSAQPDTFREFNMSRVERGNTVNLVENDTLYYKLGALENGTLSTTANVSERARALIISAVDSGRAVHLDLQVPVYFGAGAPVDFTFACAIAAARP